MRLAVDTGGSSKVLTRLGFSEQDAFPSI
jgi:hypothetical protein